VVLLSSRPGLLLRPPRAPPASGFTRSWFPFFRRYGDNLPSSLTRAHSSTLVSSTSLPVSVCGTGGVGLLAGLSRLFRCLVLGRGLPRSLGIASRSAPPGSSRGQLPTGLHGARLTATTPPQHPASSKRPTPVQDYPPVVHRLSVSGTP
jgi:hypothetical protein